jgi:nucleoside-diphosphate-sugar epimerase
MQVLNVGEFHFAGETEKFTMFGRMGYVHIDDVASCHILVYETADAKGRYICNSDVLNSNDLVAFLAKRFPSFATPKRSVTSHYTDPVKRSHHTTYCSCLVDPKPALVCVFSRLI